MTTRELSIVGDALYVTDLLGTVDADVLAGETLLDQLTTDQLLDLKLGLRAQFAQLNAAACDAAATVPALRATEQR